MSWEVGTAIKRIRDFYKLSQKDFAQSLDSTATYLSRVEHNNLKPNPMFVGYLCLKYGANREWIETGKGQPFTDKKLNRKADIEEKRPRTRMRILTTAALLAPFLPAASVGLAIGVGVEELVDRMRKVYGAKNNAELAKELGIDPSTISTWVKEERIPRTYLKKILDEKEIAEENFFIREGVIEDAIKAIIDFGHDEAEKFSDKKVPREKVKEDLFRKYPLETLPYQVNLDLC